MNELEYAIENYLNQRLAFNNALVWFDKPYLINIFMDSDKKYYISKEFIDHLVNRYKIDQHLLINLINEKVNEIVEDAEFRNISYLSMYYSDTKHIWITLNRIPLPYTISAEELKMINDLTKPSMKYLLALTN